MSALITADILTPGALEADAGTAKLVEGPRGPAGAVYTPSVTGGLLSWTNDGGLENPAPADIRGPKGDKGDPGEAGPPGADGADGAPGTGLAVLGQYDSAEALAAAVTDPALGDSYYVGESAPFDIYTWTKVGGAPQWVNGGALQGAPGGYYLPAVDAEGNLSWTASESGMDPAPGANIRGPAGPAGANGANGADGAPGAGGAPATINGVNALSIEAGDNVTLEQSGSTLTISAAGANALVVTISGAEGALAADKTNAEIWAAYQAGTPMYAIWDGTVLTPVQVESDWALFGYDLPPMSGSVSISESGGAAEVLGETGQLSASQVSFDPTDFGMESTNVQDAFYELMYLLGLL